MESAVSKSLNGFLMVHGIGYIEMDGLNKVVLQEMVI